MIYPLKLAEFHATIQTTTDNVMRVRPEAMMTASEPKALPFSFARRYGAFIDLRGPAPQLCCRPDVHPRTLIDVRRQTGRRQPIRTLRTEEFAI